MADDIGDERLGLDGVTREERSKCSERGVMDEEIKSTARTISVGSNNESSDKDDDGSEELETSEDEEDESEEESDEEESSSEESYGEELEESER